MPQSAEFFTPFAEVALSNVTRQYAYAAHYPNGQAFSQTVTAQDIRGLLEGSGSRLTVDA